MTTPVGRARELYSKYKNAHLPVEMAVVQLAFEFPDDETLPVLGVAEALGVDPSVIDYIYAQLKEERKAQSKLVEKARTPQENKFEEQVNGPSSSEEAFFANFGKANGWRKFGETNSAPPRKAQPKSTFNNNVHKGKPWENAPAHLINHCAQLLVPWPLDEAVVKKAYRAIAMETHPDRFVGDDAKAQAFKAATESYDRLTAYIANLKDSK